MLGKVHRTKSGQCLFTTKDLEKLCQLAERDTCSYCKLPTMWAGARPEWTNAQHKLPTMWAGARPEWTDVQHKLPTYRHQ